ncbi:MAG: hypothetical protein OXC72_14855 [Roseovarius sp.]|nr:hypothetical protein [Roseovarius sp.]
MVPVEPMKRRLESHVEGQSELIIHSRQLPFFANHAFSIKKLKLNDFLLNKPKKPSKKSTKHFFKNPFNPLNNLIKK